MTITTTAINNNDEIDQRYTGEGEDVNPPLTFSQIPDGTESLALIMDDPDAPNGTFTHWVLYDMNPATLQITEDQLPAGAKVGMNDFGRVDYGGPMPPSGTHRYYFKLYALDTMLNLPEGTSRNDLEQAMEDHIIETAELMGTYTKSS